MRKESLSIALVQMTSVDSLAANLQKFESVFTSLKPNSVDLICFPENCLYMRIRESDSVERFELSHSCFMWLGEWAKRLGATIHLGSVPLVLDGRLYNSSVWIGDDGVAQVGYQKIHLFDIELQGQKPYKESAVFDRGASARLLEFKGWKIGESICYDLRFSELYSTYAYSQADLILIPAAFLVETGKVHWEILLRARAIESQCYIVASAQVGSHQSTKAKGERNTFGHSMLIDPWGLVEADLGEKPVVQICEVSKERIKKIRSQIPMASHRQGHKDIVI